MRSLLLIAGLSLALAGCRNAELAQVSGKVSLAGKPLSGAQVTFHPVGAGRPAYGTTSPDGVYRLRVGDVEGLLPNEYRITVICLGPSQPAAPRGMPGPGPRLTPEVYSSAERTPLVRRVLAGENTIDLDLESSR